MPSAPRRADPDSVKAMVTEMGKRMLAMMDEEDRASMTEAVDALKGQLAKAKAEGGDTAELEGQIAMMQGMLDGEVSPEAMQEMTGALDVTLELAADGSVTMRSGPEEDDVDHGTWKLDGNTVEIVGDADAAEVHMTGTIDGDRMELREAPGGDDGSDDITDEDLAGLVLVMIRQ
ncbi:MAG: hypothetical protein U1E14_03495 [Geminicoccaceae bacterium]